VKEYEKKMEKENNKNSISETRDIIREVLLEQKSERLINEAISLFEKEGDSPTFEWDIAQEKLDQSIENIFTGTQAKEYLIKFLDRIKSLPRQIKIRLAKYVATSLIGLIGIGTISNVFSGQASDIQKDVISSIQKEVNKSEFKAPTNVSNELIEFLKGEEGIGGKPVLTAYDIGDGAYTIGYGHAIFRNPNRGSTGGDYDFLPQYKNITPGKTRITPQQAETLLRDDVNEAKLILDDILNNWKGQGIRVEIDQQMYDAMVSMIYNMGREKFATSEFIQHVKKGDFISAAESIDKIDAPALLNKFPGLLNRRAGEKQIFSMNLHIPYEINESVIPEGVSPSEFTVAYFQKRIPFLKGYDIDYSPGDLSYQHGMEDRIQMSKNAMSKNVTIPFGDDLVTFPSVYISSDFFYYPHKVDENTFYVLGIKNKFSFMEPSNMNPLEFRVFNAAVHAKQEKEFSVIHEIMVHDGQEIPESEINTAINDINKKMFNLEDEISAWQIDNLF
jgi:GH24 family phage-related lysozyme (muramidase)